MAETTETRGERERRWWDNWYTSDYSWQGLAQKNIRGGGQFGEKNLQDYWRRDPSTGEIRTDAKLKACGELVELDGRWWHLVHLPLRGPNGQLSCKSDPGAPEWVRIGKLLANRLDAASETAGEFKSVPLEDRNSLLRDQSFLFWRPSVLDGRALFDGAVIVDLNIRNVESISISCRNVIFIGACDFSQLKFYSGSDFANSFFRGGCKFDGVNFLGESLFDNSIFFGDAYFRGCGFSGKTSFSFSVFVFNVNFRGARFLSEVKFNDIYFCGDAVFAVVVFSRRVVFTGVKFCKYSNFRNSTFSGHVNFSGEFGDGAQFWGAIFEGAVSFRSIIYRPEQSFSGAFYGARFLGVADFSGAVGEGQGGRMVAAFAQAQFEKALILTDGLDGRHGQRFYRSLLAKTRPDDVDIKSRNAAFAALESGCRAVKIAMGRARDDVREQAYYRLQVRARQQRSDIDWSEKIVAWIYGVVSDFGSSLWRPLLALLLVTVCSGYIYAFWAASLNVGRLVPLLGRDAVFEGQGVALSALKPFSTLESPREMFLSDRSRPNVDPDRRGDVASRSLVGVLTINPAVALGFRIVTMGQVVVSTLLIFLFGLAVKRRFQIS